MEKDIEMTDFAIFEAVSKTIYDALKEIFEKNSKQNIARTAFEIALKNSQNNGLRNFIYQLTSGNTLKDYIYFFSILLIGLIFKKLLSSTLSNIII